MKASIKSTEKAASLVMMYGLPVLQASVALALERARLDGRREGILRAAKFCEKHVQTYDFSGKCGVQKGHEIAMNGRGYAQGLRDLAKKGRRS